MKRKILFLLAIVLCLIGVSGCSKKDEKAALAFKKEYEALNGVVNKNGKEHRTLDINKDNPYVKTTPEKIVKMIDENKTFYLYVGDPLCPWCRSVLEKSIEIANEKKINTIYYIDIWDDEGNEILRDKYEIKDGKANKIIDGTEAYFQLLKSFDSVLNDYNLNDKDATTIHVGEKRIYAPNYFYIKNGKVEKMIDGISDKQTDSREELTQEILLDEENQFRSFFSE